MSQAPPPLAHLHAAQVRVAEVVLEAVLQGAAADRALARQLRDMPKAGSRDRRWISALVFGVLRAAVALRRRHGDDIKRWLADWLCHTADAPPERLVALGLPALGTNHAAQDAGSTPGTSRDTAGDAGAPPEALWPDWLLAAAREALDEATVRALAEGLRGEAAVDLRVNRLRASPDEARAALAAEGIEARPVPGAPDALRLTGRRPLQATRAWREGMIEPQDAGSQRLCALLAPAPGERIADWCAGAGGKALALAAAMRNRGEVIALDVDARRLQRMGPRARRLGVRIIRTAVLGQDGSLAEGVKGTAFDGVLVDAPCSGVGTLRRRPELVLRAVDIPALQRLQARILRQAAAAVRPGGRLVS